MLGIDLQGQTLLGIDLQGQTLHIVGQSVATLLYLSQEDGIKLPVPQNHGSFCPVQFTEIDKNSPVNYHYPYPTNVLFESLDIFIIAFIESSVFNI